tara:strand:- start:36 stop:554 length:519 start_codon:yes stop_codon:yes gene_type:complete
MLYLIQDENGNVSLPYNVWSNIIEFLIAPKKPARPHPLAVKFKYHIKRIYIPNSKNYHNEDGCAALHRRLYRPPVTLYTRRSWWMQRPGEGGWMGDTHKHTVVECWENETPHSWEQTLGIQTKPDEWQICSATCWEQTAFSEKIKIIKFYNKYFKDKKYIKIKLSGRKIIIK